jgi:hypothetical protein
VSAREYTEDELYFTSKGLMQLQPSISEGWPQGHLFPLLTFSEKDMENIVELYLRRFNLTVGQQELLSFIKHVHRIHRQEMDYSRVWQRSGRLNGPLFIFIFMDDYDDQSGWEYGFANPDNVHEIDMQEEDRQRIIEEMDRSSPERMKLNFLYVEKTERYPEQKFLMEIWSTLPTEGNLERLSQTAQQFRAVFASLQSEEFSLHDHSSLVETLVSEDRGDLLRVGLENLSIDHPLTPLEFDYQQFIVRIRELVRMARNPAVEEGWRAGEKATMLMMYRMADTEDAFEYRGTYGPIVRLTRTVITEFLFNLEQEKTSADEEQLGMIEYGIRLYERNLELIDEMEEGSLNFLFVHEEWMHKHEVPFAYLVQNFTTIE